jgi:hypothetical protein
MTRRRPSSSSARRTRPPSNPTRETPGGTKDGYVFTTGWGEPTYPDAVTSLMTKLIRAHNEPDEGPRPKIRLPHARLHDLRHITSQPCCSPACLSM